MEFRTLQYFLAVVRERNITRAAEALHVTQPTLSRQMSQLEAELGAQLFERGRQLTLTEAGEALVRRAEEAVALMAHIDAEVGGRETLVGEIAVGTGVLLSARHIVKAVRAFHERWPQVRCRLHTNSADHLKERLDAGDLDFALLLEPVDMDRYDYVRMPQPEPWGLLMPADHPLAAQTSVTRADVASTPLAVTDRPALQRELAGWMGEGYDSLDIEATYNVVDAAALLVEDGGVCALTTQGAGRQLGGGALTFRPLEPPLEMTCALAWRRSVPLSRAGARFLDYLKSCISRIRTYNE
ncbi:MAG: LysR family transcriptional regulator [Coriobacteriia bacterium]|nr:LysR family transcriptional regulator [Coriobacteriia bacterium]MBS5477078.1 LysR family transcriptional regulator [Coriobacteriia bacterium]